MTIVDLAIELISIPSHEKEEEVGNAIEKWLKEETDANVSQDKKGNIIASRGSGEKLAFIGHHDVVPPETDQMDGNRCKVFEKEDRIYGRGAADMKGAISSMMHAFRDADPTGELVFASFVGEEKGGLGAEYSISNGFLPKFIVVGEGSASYSKKGVVDIVVAHRGREETEIIIQGEEAHASQSKEGKNAIYMASDIIQGIESFDLREMEILGKYMKESVTVTRIEGGTMGNVIPGECRITIDHRTIPSENEIEFSGENINLNLKRSVPAFICKDMSFAKWAQEIANEVTYGSKLVTKPHATDAGWFSIEGCIGVVCGPAEMGEAHTSEESVSIEALEKCYEIYRKMGETNI